MKAPEFALPVKGDKVPASPAWLHEVKYDGYRLMLVRDQARVRLLSKGGIDWTKRFPLIVESALKIRRQRFVVDGEAVLLGVDGISDFDGLQSGKFDDEVQLYSFDCLIDDQDDLRSLPLSMRKASLDRLLARRSDGIFAAPFEMGEIGPDLFKAACGMGLEGLVSNSGRAYRPGRCAHWIKVKNPAHPAMKRVERAMRAKYGRA